MKALAISSFYCEECRKIDLAIIELGRAFRRGLISRDEKIKPSGLKENLQQLKKMVQENNPLPAMKKLVQCYQIYGARISLSYAHLALSFQQKDFKRAAEVALLQLKQYPEDGYLISCASYALLKLGDYNHAALIAKKIREDGGRFFEVLLKEDKSFASFFQSQRYPKANCLKSSTNGRIL